jgi:hypothetical protein
MKAVGDCLIDMLKSFDGMKGRQIRDDRRQKFLEMGTKGLTI